MDKETQLAELRREIDGIDAKIVELVDQRADVVRRVGELKGATGTAVFRPERENLILERAASLSRNFDGPAGQGDFPGDNFFLQSLGANDHGGVSRPCGNLQ